MERGVMHYINRIKFGSISDENVKNLSVKEIILPKAIDKDYNAISQGPHDLALGPLGFNDVCITCGLNYYQCPGHLGHIQFPMIIYNPMLFKTLYWILKGSCIFCFRLLAPRIQTLLITKQIDMLNYGVESAVCDLNKIVNGMSTKKLSEEKMPLEDIANNYYNYLEGHFDKYIINFLKEHSVADDICPSKNILEIKENITKDYIKKYHLASYKSCPHCHAKLPSIKVKDNSKIILLFAKRTSAKPTELFSDNNKNFVKVDPNDNDALIWTKPSIKGEQSLMPLEAKNIVKNIFNIPEQLKTLSSLFEIIKYETTGDQSRIFFIKNLPVIPSKFRPVNAIGDSKFVGGQTLTYTKILAACQLLKETSGDLIGQYSCQDGANPSDLSVATLVVDSKNRSALQRFSFKSERQSVNLKKESVALNEQSVKAFLMVWQYLQACVNLLIEPDETLFPKEKLKGIKQILEKKEGLFRKHMMGKRVNFAARSVISPDPYIRVDEIGVPQIFAQKLTFPEPVNCFNVDRLRQAIINGPAKYPGAYSVQNSDGSTVFLNPKRPEQRQAIARLLTVPNPTLNRLGVNFKMASHRDNTQNQTFAAPNPVQIVNRHLLDGDMLLLNRQPTLHKPSIMAHKARVLPGERTLRLHYAHCKAYNADFDGDEMNAHLPQSLPCASEARYVTGNQLIYLGPKDGRPLTGLIQDHLVAAVRMTVRGQFFGRSDYHQLIYAALQGSPNLANRAIKTQPPAILKPSRLWSGKQIISTILQNLISTGTQALNMYGKGKIKEDLYLQPAQERGCAKQTPFLSETQVVVRRGDWLTGIFDKSQFGASPFGLIHCCQELYCGQVASDILTSLGRVFTAYLQIAGFTLGIKDILVNIKGDKVRKKIVKEGRTEIGPGLLVQVFGEDQQKPDLAALANRWEKAFVTKDEKLLQDWESASKRATDGINNRISEYIMSRGLLTSFPRNNLLLMVHSGAKGTLVNCMQICCLLGQIELEGRRPPMLITGRTLPSFKPYDPTPRAHGFIDYRFLSGLKPQDYFFHCMAGREGLIDTAVKTSHSGYLQRCIIKHLEGLKVSYDSTVRDSDGSVIQFLYGEDGLEVTKSQYLVNGSEIEFLLSNHSIAAPPLEIKAVKASVDKKDLKAVAKEKRLYKKFQPMEIESIESNNSKMPPPLISQYAPAKVFGSVSANLQSRIDGYEPLFETQSTLLKQIQNDSSNSSPYPRKDFPSSFKNLEDVIYLKSMKSMAEPGEAVGLLCAQSIGEPSTQMTLNTFHFAGRGEMNVTLGIPRLREILMTATRNLKTPMMSAPFRSAAAKGKKIHKISRNFQQIFYRQVITQVEVEESVLSDHCSKLREVFWVYRIRFNLLPYKCLKKLLPTCDKNSIHAGLERRLLPKLVQTIKKEDSCLNNIKLFESRKKLGIFLEGAVLVEQGIDKNAAGENDDANAQTDDAQAEASTSKAARTSSSSESSVSSEDENTDMGAFSDGDAASFDAQASEYDTDTEGESAHEKRSSVARSSSGVSDMDDDVHSATHKRKSPCFTKDDGLGTDDPDSALPSPKKVSTSKKVKSEANDNKDKIKNEPFGSQTDRQRIKNVLDISKYITHYAYESGDQPWSAEVTLQIPLSENKIDMEVLLEKEIKTTLFHSIPGVISSIVSEPDTTTQCRSLQIQGINIPEIFNYGKSLDLNKVYCNDLHQILETYGIEACRNAIIKEVQKVFSAYGIQVDYRHLSLISDYMTFDGYYRPFNRYSMSNQASPFLKMSFESTFTFLKDALISGASDDLETPTARIVMGREIKTGTGCFDLMQKLF